MVKKESLQELEGLVRENPTKTCYPFARGKMFAILEGDESCLTGQTQKSGEEEILGKKYMIYVGGEIIDPTKNQQ